MLKKSISDLGAISNSLLYCSIADKIYFRYINHASGATCIIRIRFLDLLGNVQTYETTEALASDGISYTIELNVGEGYILSASISASTSNVLKGQCYASLSIGIPAKAGASRNALSFINGYLSSNQSLSYPSATSQIIESNGALISISPTIADPGAQSTHTLEEHAVYTIKAVTARLTTVATAATRRMVINFSYAGASVYRFGATTTQSSSTSRTYLFIAGLTTEQQITTYTEPMTQGITLPGGSIFTTAVENLQVDDEITSVLLYVERLAGI
jgi:hypothetical protein